MTRALLFSPVSLEELLPALRELIQQENELLLSKLTFEERLLSPRAALRVFDPPISRTSLHNWTRRGLLTKHYVGTQPYYKLSEILQAARSLKKYSRA